MKKITTKMFALAMAVFMSQDMMAQTEILFEEHFDEESLCSFRVEGDNEPLGDPIWVWDDSWDTVKADAFGRISEDYESCLVSPGIQLTRYNTLAFDMYSSYFVSMSDVALVIREEGATEWEKIEYDVPKSEDIINTGMIAIDPKFDNKKVEIGFYYTSPSSYSSGLWVLDNIVVKGEKIETGIDEVNADEANDVKVFDLQGRRVYNPGKGIYIVNGKKMMIR